MDRPAKAIFFFEEDDSIPADGQSLWLEPVLFCPVLNWACRRLVDDGVKEFLAVCGPRFQEEVRACLPKDVDMTVSQQQSDLTAFLNTPAPVLVFSRAALPMEEAGPGFAYAAAGYELRESWKERLSNNVAGAELVSGWLPLFGLDTVAEVELRLRDSIVKGHLKNGVRILDPSAVYMDPRVTIGAGTVLLPGVILRGETHIGKNCTVGPQAMVEDSDAGDGVVINASQVQQSRLGDGCDVGPYAHIRPNCTVGPKCHVGAFVQLKNCVLGRGTKMSHLTYVGDADVGEDVNFGCGTITTNYDGFQKHRCTIQDHAFIGCNTNLIAPVTVGEGSYIAAGSTVTQEVPAGALAVARSRQKNLDGWAARRRASYEKKK